MFDPILNIIQDSLKKFLDNLFNVNSNIQGGVL